MAGLDMTIGSPHHGVRRWSAPVHIREVIADYRAAIRDRGVPLYTASDVIQVSP